MKNRTVTITVSASFDEVFSFLANPETLPLWATSFSKAVRKESQGWVVETGQGELAFAIDADRSSGCIEMLAGPTAEVMESFPIRVYKADNGQTVASFTMFMSQRPGMTEALFEMHYRKLVNEVESLLERFGGGEISTGLPGASSFCLGLVTESLAVSRDFYVEKLGFKAVFDAPCYAHLVRETDGAQIGLMASTSEAGQSELENGTQGKGLWITLYVEDVDAEFERLRSEGVVFREEPTDQPWGERTCVLADPNGVLIYLSKLTGKMDESLKQYVVTGEPVLVS
ncbi:VOC family protein [Pelagicoccus mobilis]|uniref:VOC family protein n=1 Tax=Pelagicoccus mobilis TaxID=415221 RepID=A0A934VT85_9BACT|nr:VOC family protein [Pelagicoccus mobilis]MBK1879259.1 VOC family protein [Pelagicoccus mobilis]